ncbi:Electron transport complex subunit RsxC [Klebsiella quasipneumoniae subsp. similipneumoniae]|nr:Electron transport complex subunit RsxC [Klebsiella quasipneumoniae subsp. similipneumoniae]
MFKLFSAFRKDKVWDFNGGIHPPEMKTQSNGTPLRQVSLPQRFVIPLKQHIGAEGELCVKVGDRVLRGQPLTRGWGRMLPVHAPTSGTVAAIAPHTTAHPSALAEMSVIIDADGEDRWIERDGWSDYQTRTREALIERIHQFGVAGLGGAGFPTGSKLRGGGDKIKTLIINAAECEPMLKVDQQLMWQQAARLVRGVQYAMTATGAREGVIALKEKYRRAIDALTPLLPAGIRLPILPDVYPAGDEVLTIWLATGRRVAPAALPASVGVVVNNVQTVLNIARAVEQQFPVTRRTLTVNGAVAKPLTITVPIGMPLREVLALAGGATVDDPGFINGGPMMGGLITSLDNPVTKTTGGLLVLPKSHPLIQRRMQDERTVLSVARTVCEQCRLCTDLCPRHLIGHELSPHLLVRAVNFHQAATPQLLLSALTCSECNVCESVACPVGISPMRINRMLKRELRAQNQRYEGPLYPADEMAKYRLVPVKRLIAKLGLSPWYQEAPLVEDQPSVEKVTLQLRQHIGASAVPNVAVGERVTRGQCVADIPAGALGAPVHASIDGVVTTISEQAITVVRG